jgi:hypothetical protein
MAAKKSAKTAKKAKNWRDSIDWALAGKRSWRTRRANLKARKARAAKGAATRAAKKAATTAEAN